MIVNFDTIMFHLEDLDWVDTAERDGSKWLVIYRVDKDHIRSRMVSTEAELANLRTELEGAVNGAKLALGST